MGLEHPAVGPVVVRRDDERRIGAELRRATGRADRGGGVVGAGPGDHPDATARRPLATATSTVAAMSRSRSASVRVGDSPVVPHGHEAVDAGEDLPADEPAEGGLVEGRRRG